MDGLLIIDKPKGPTSHDVVARVRRAIGERRVGHTGTLDPMARGVLPLVLGRATRLARFLSAGDKTYEAVIQLGVATDSYDAEGVPTRAPYEGPMPSRDEIDRALDAFRGVFFQQPPRFSAKKIDGRRSYRIARKRPGQLFSTGGGAPPPPQTEADASLQLHTPSLDTPSQRGDRAGDPDMAAGAHLPTAVSVTAHEIEIVSLDDDLLRLRVHCSAGFYVRSLAHDLGERLGTGAHLADLRRTRSGDATLTQAMPLDLIEADRQRGLEAVLPVARMLTTFSAVVLTTEGVRRAGHGRDLGPADFEKGAESRVQTEDTRPTPDAVFVRLLDSAGQLIGIARPVAASGLLHPSVILK